MTSPALALLARFLPRFSEMDEAERLRVCDRVRGDLRVLRHGTVDIADSDDFYDQMAGDHRAAWDMADSINSALTRDRGKLVDELLAREVAAGDAIEYLRFVDATLTAECRRPGYGGRMASGVGRTVLEAMRLGCGRRGLVRGGV